MTTAGVAGAGSAGIGSGAGLTAAVGGVPTGGPGRLMAPGGRCAGAVPGATGAAPGPDGFTLAWTAAGKETGIDGRTPDVPGWPGDAGGSVTAAGGLACTGNAAAAVVGKTKAALGRGGGGRAENSCGRGGRKCSGGGGGGPRPGPPNIKARLWKNPSSRGGGGGTPNSTGAKPIGGSIAADR